MGIVRSAERNRSRMVTSTGPSKTSDKHNPLDLCAGESFWTGPGEIEALTVVRVSFHARKIMLRITRIIGGGLVTLAAALYIACGGCGGNTTMSSQSSRKVSRSTPPRKWYEGGTLHKKGALEWQMANAANKLATCSDFVAAMWKQKNFVPRIQNSINSPDDMKPYAQELVDFLDAATKRHEDPDQNSRIYANQTVSSMATIGMVSMGWLE